MGRLGEWGVWARGWGEEVAGNGVVWQVEERKWIGGEGVCVGGDDV